MRTKISQIHKIFLISFLLQSAFPTYAYRKCCKKGAQMAENGKHCILRADIEYKSSNNYIQHEVLESNFSLYWMPSNLFYVGMTVHYEMPICSEKDIVIFSMNDTSRFKFTSDENLQIFSEHFPFQSEIFNNDSYCLEAIFGNMGPYIVRVCACETVTCVNKCCPKGFHLQSETEGLTCFSDYSPPAKAPIIINESYKRKYVLYRYPTTTFCEDGKIEFVSRRGKIVNSERVRNFDKLFSEVEKCVEVLKVKEQDSFRVASCSRPKVLEGVEYLTRALSGVAALFHILTLFTLFTLSELRANTHGRALTSHVFCLTVVNALRLASYLHGGNRSTCLKYAISVYFFLVAAGFWVNALSLDMADGLRRPFYERVVGVSGSWKRTIIFGVYAWGTSAVLTAITIHGEFCNNCELPKPTYQETRTCFTESEYLSRKGTLTYYYGPMGVIFLINLFIYAYLAIRLHRLEKDAGIDEELTIDSEAQQRRASIFFRLLMMMGIVEWLVEIVMWGLRGKYRSTEFLKIYDRFASAEDERHSLTVFHITAVVLDVVRAASLAWLCCGRPRVRRRLGESVRRTLTRTLSRPLRFASALGHSSASDDDDGAATGGRASQTLAFLRQSFRRLRKTFSGRVKPTSTPSPSDCEERKAASAVPEEIEMRTFSISSIEDVNRSSNNDLYKL